jgi:hypothetical protein
MNDKEQLVQNEARSASKALYVRRLAEKIARYGVQYDQNNRLYTAGVGIGPDDVEALAVAFLQEPSRS